MAKPLKHSAASLVAAARAQIEEIDSEAGQALLERDDVLIVDLRDVRERQRDGFIPGSFHCPRGMLEFWVDPESPYFKEEFGEDKTFVFHCASGWRLAISTQLVQHMGLKKVAHLRDGFKGWEAAGGPIEKAPPRP